MEETEVIRREETEEILSDRKADGMRARIVNPDGGNVLIIYLRHLYIAYNLNSVDSLI